MDTTSYWIDTAGLPQFSKLKQSLAVDVVVVGGGITGITAAYLLKKAGRTVALLERERCARIDTGHTTAHLTCVTDQRLHDSIKLFGKERTKGVWEAGLAAIDQIVANIRSENITCDFNWVPGYLHTPLNGDRGNARKLLQKDAELANELGLRADYVESIPFVQLPGVRFPNQAKFHPRKYLAALLRTIPGNGSHVFEHPAAGEVEEKPLAVKVGELKIECAYILLATHNPLMGKTNLVSSTLFQTKLALYTSYAIGAKVPQGSILEALFWDTDDPYHYLRIDRHRGFDYAIFGGEDHKTGQESDTKERYEHLEELLRKLIPSAVVDHYWSGQVIETNDGLPLIGETAAKQFAATGFSGNGMTFGTLGAMMCVDAFLGRKNPWQELFDVHRKKIRGGTWDYLKENKDYPYYLVRDWLAKPEGKSLRVVKRGQGKILNLNGKKVAASRDENGQIFLCSPVCTHMGCIVGWNQAEKTWDCPCHGSRFKPNGDVIAGPAETPLEKVEQPSKA